MAIGKANTGGGGSGGTLTVNAPVGVTVTATKDGKTYTRTANAQGIATFKGLSTGVWAVTISDGVQLPTTQLVTINADYEMTIAFFAAYIYVTYPEGSTCKCTKGAYEFTDPDTSGSVAFIVPEVGDWVVSCTDSTNTASQTVTITADGQTASVALNYNQIPVFTYTGDYEIVDDNDNPITTSPDNWKVRFLTSGILTFSELLGAENGIDVFCVGGGGCSSVGNSGGGAGGGGGYTKTSKNINVATSTAYQIIIGAGTKSYEADGGNTSAFGLTAFGGKGGIYANGKGGNGGSGGASYEFGKKGGVDGADGESGVYLGGTGQHTTTREFEESNGKLYATGGDSDSRTPIQNTGDGGSGGNTGWGSSSGIVVIRNAREVS